MRSPILISMKKMLHLSILLIFFQSMITSNAFAQVDIPDDFCIHEEEYNLLLLINEYRKVMNLQEIQLSNSLSYVAHLHTTDLIENNPDTNTCNFHSWSDKGTWTACCFEKEIDSKNCMQVKPKEITNYPGLGYEIVYWENKEATANKAMNQWRETPASRSILTNFKEWENFRWNACGVAIKGGFAIVWLGEEFDTEPETRICGKEITIKNEPPAQEAQPQVVSEVTNRFYIIFGNFNNLEDAKKMIKGYVDAGFSKAKIIYKDNKYRISLSDYPTKELASDAKKELPAKFKDAWIMPF